jgi:hypothetical protein
LTQLLHLSLNGNRLIGDTGVTLIARVLSAAPTAATLTRLELAAVGASDKSATELALALRQCKQLRQLRMSENRFGFDGAVALAKALQHRTGAGSDTLDTQGETSERLPANCSSGAGNAAAEDAANTGGGGGSGGGGGGGGSDSSDDSAALMQQLSLQGTFAYDVAALHPVRLDPRQAKSLVADPGAAIFGRRVLRNSTAIAVAVAGSTEEDGTEDIDEESGKLPMFVDLTHNLLFKSGKGGLVPYFTQQSRQAGEEEEDEGEVTDTSLDDPFDFGDDDGDY